MGIPKGYIKTYFPKVKEAREALREKALELFELQVQIIRQALLKGDFESAYKANQWLLEHMPASDEGQRIIDTSAATPKEVSQGTGGPTIRIGIALGGITPKSLPEAQPEVIDVTPRNGEEPDDRGQDS